MRQNPAKRISLLIVVILSLVLTGMIFFNLISPSRMTIRRIQIENAPGISNNQILALPGISNGWPLNIDEKKIESKLEEWPWVRSAKITRIFPDTLKISFQRRTPIVATMSEKVGGMTTVCFDEEGYVVQVGKVSGYENLLILSGISFDVSEPGARLPDGLQEIIRNLAEIKHHEPELYDRISEVEILSRSTGILDLRLFMNNRAVPVLIGNNLTIEKVKRVELVGNILSSGAVGNVIEADIRGRNVVYVEGTDDA